MQLCIYMQIEDVIRTVVEWEDTVEWYSKLVEEGRRQEEVHVFCAKLNI